MDDKIKTAKKVIFTRIFIASKILIYPYLLLPIGGYLCFTFFDRFYRAYHPILLSAFALAPRCLCEKKTSLKLRAFASLRDKITLPKLCACTPVPLRAK
jgi:hypothetical protein